MKEKDKLNLIKSILSEEFGIQKEAIETKSHLIDDLNLSSLEISDLILRISEVMDLIITEDIEIHKIQTVEDLIILAENYSDDI